MMWRWIYVVVATLLTTCLGQDQNYTERGVILTAYPYSSYAVNASQLRHIPVMPYYEAFNTSTTPAIRFTNKYIQFVSVDVDFAMKQIYMYDYYLRAIAVGYDYDAHLNVTSMEFEFMHIGVSRGTVQVAVDWLSHTVYWVDAVFGWIVAAPGAKEKIKLDIYKVIVDTNLDQPDGIAVDPLKGLLFWSDNGKHPKIERSDLSGGNRKTLITRGLNSPLSMEVDIFEKRIYWLDSYTETLNSATYEGKDRKIITRIDTTILFDIGIYKEMAILTDIYNDEVYFLNKTTGKELAKPFIKKYETFYGVAVYNSEIQPLRNVDHCENLNCPHVCITTDTSAKCVCGDGYTFNKTTNNCTEDLTELGHKAIVIANTTHICLIDIRMFAHYAYEVRCIFTVILPNPEQTMTTHSSRKKRQAAQTTPATSAPVTQLPQPTSTPRQPSMAQTTPVPPTTTTPMPTTTPAPTAAPGDMITHFTLNVEKRVIYFSTVDNKIYKRFIGLPIENTEKVLLVSAKGTISGLVFDWINANNLYWSESQTGYLYVVDVNTNAVSRINTVAYSNPRSLVLLPHERRLAWIANNGSTVSIESVDLTGADFKPLASGTNDLSSLAVDQHSQKLYCFNQTSSTRRYIYEFPYNSTKNASPVYVVSADTGAFKLLVYKNYLVWAYKASSGDTSYKSYDYKVKRTIASGTLDTKDTKMELVDMNVLDADVQPSEPNACAYENGMCEQICMTHHQGLSESFVKVCECTLGYTLDADGMSCKSDLASDDFIMATDWTNDAIYQITIATDKTIAFHIDKATTFMGVLYDGRPGHEKLIWSEYYESEIYSSGLDGLGHQAFADTGYNYVNRFALDESSGYLYFSTYDWSSISVVTPSGEYLEIIEFSYQDIGGVAVHPEKGWVFYTLTNTYYPEKTYVGRADMDGKNEKELIQGTHVVKPDGVAIDYQNDHLYWSDSSTNIIQKCDLEGENCDTFVNDTLAQIKDIATDGEYLYYTGWNRDHVAKVDLGTKVKTMMGASTELGRLDTISVYKSNSKNKQPGNTVCAANNGKGDCSTMCFPTPAGHTCGCEFGDYIKDDGRTCSNIYQCDAITQKVDGNKIGIILNSDCTSYLGENCSYSCPSGFLPVNGSNIQMTCTNVGWNRQFDNLCEEIKCPVEISNGRWDESCERVLGDMCTFKCDEGFQKSIDYVICIKDGEWSKDSKEVCTVNKCEDAIKHGSLDKGCSREANTYCLYSCDKGYYTPQSDKKITCQIDGKWDMDTDTVCKEIKCPSTIENGKVLPCPANIGSGCDYKCTSGFRKPIGVDKLYCLEDGKWYAHGKTACLAKCKTTEFSCGDTGVCIPNTLVCDGKLDCPDNSDEDSCRICPGTLENGKPDTKCNMTHGAICDLVCDKGYTNSTDKVACSNQNLWHPDNACQEIMCPSTIENGFITEKCSRKVNSTCQYGCRSVFRHTSTVGAVKCLESGQWNLTSKLCLEPIPTADKQTGDSGSKSESIGLGVGLAIAVLVVLALIVVLVLFFRRMKGSGPNYNMAAYSNGSRRQGDIAIENPGYDRPVISVKNDAYNDPPYDSIDPGQMQPARFTTPESDSGIVNPVYMHTHAEPLRDVAHVDITQENVQLTNDSWLREQAKGPDADIAGNNIGQ